MSKLKRREKVARGAQQADIFGPEVQAQREIAQLRGQVAALQVQLDDERDARGEALGVIDQLRAVNASARLPTGSVRVESLRIDQIVRAGSRSSCLCCGQIVAGRKRPLHKLMARWLVELCARYDRAAEGAAAPVWIHRNSIHTTQLSNDYGDLLRFSIDGAPLVEQAPGAKPGTVSPGLWRPTEAGRRFVAGELRAPAWILVYNGCVLDQAPELVTIEQALCVDTRAAVEQMLQEVLK